MKKTYDETAKRAYVDYLVSLYTGDKKDEKKFFNNTINENDFSKKELTA